MANTKTLNSIFGRPAVVSARPDGTWPLPSDFVGIEIEVENYEGDSILLYPTWVTHSDGSLRNGVEFVTGSPIGGEELTAAIDQFFSHGHTYETGPRTSVHVHINASDNMNVDQFRNMLVLMYVIEPAVFRWADENRKWCGYCAPLTDISPTRFVTMLNENDNDAALVRAIRGEGNHDRYFGFNVAAYGKHGTVEFRYFPCTTDRELMIKWIKFVMYVKKAACSYQSVPEMLQAMDGDTPLRMFLANHFPDVYEDLSIHIDTLDAQVRVRDILSAIHVKSNHDRSPVMMTLKNPAVHKLINKTFPDHKGLITANEAKDEEARTARELFVNFTSRGLNPFDAYTRVASRVGHGAAAQALHESQEQQEAQRAAQQRTLRELQQRANARFANFISSEDAWATMSEPVPPPAAPDRPVRQRPAQARNATPRTRNPFEASGDE